MDVKRIAELRELAECTKHLGHGDELNELLDEVERLQAEIHTVTQEALKWQQALDQAIKDYEAQLARAQANVLVKEQYCEYRDAQLTRARDWVQQFLHAFYEHSKLANDELAKYDAAVEGNTAIITNEPVGGTLRLDAEMTTLRTKPNRTCLLNKETTMLNEILAEIEARADADCEICEGMGYDSSGVDCSACHATGLAVRTDVPRLVAAVRELVKQRNDWAARLANELDYEDGYTGDEDAELAAILRGEQ